MDKDLSMRFCVVAEYGFLFIRKGKLQFAPTSVLVICAVETQSCVRCNLWRICFVRAGRRNTIVCLYNLGRNYFGFVQGVGRMIIRQYIGRMGVLLIGIVVGARKGKLQFAPTLWFVYLRGGRHTIVCLYNLTFIYWRIILSSLVIGGAWSE